MWYYGWCRQTLSILCIVFLLHRQWHQRLRMHSHEKSFVSLHCLHMKTIEYCCGKCCWVKKKIFDRMLSCELRLFDYRQCDWGLHYKNSVITLQPVDPNQMVPTILLVTGVSKKWYWYYMMLYDIILTIFKRNDIQAILKLFHKFCKKSTFAKFLVSCIISISGKTFKSPLRGNIGSPLSVLLFCSMRDGEGW